MEKIILRWRRKRRGLRGFQIEKQLEGSSSQTLQIQPAKSEAEDEYEFLKDGRKQAEGRLQRALARVHSMTQYPEARDQYRRLQTSVNGLQESQVLTLFSNNNCPLLEHRLKHAMSHGRSNFVHDVDICTGSAG